AHGLLHGGSLRGSFRESPAILPHCSKLPQQALLGTAKLVWHVAEDAGHAMNCVTKNWVGSEPPVGGIARISTLSHAAPASRARVAMSPSAWQPCPTSVATLVVPLKNLSSTCSRGFPGCPVWRPK